MRIIWVEQNDMLLECLRTKGFAIAICLMLLLQACSTTRRNRSFSATVQPVVAPELKNAGRDIDNVPPIIINTRKVVPDSVVAFAETLIGVKYKYGSAVKDYGFDCSGFITYVFNHFEIKVPRVSRDFTNAGYPVPIEKSKAGDLILFTGTDTVGWRVGHMGIITQNDNGKIQFIHSASGKSIGVIISGMSKYFETRFVKVIRVFKQEVY
jgi:cell wall-associated NlpC family hydrolase